MRKYIIIVIILSIINLILYKYLISINLSKKPFEFKESNDYYIYQINDIEIQDINSFVIDKYININTFNHVNYKYEFNDSNLIVYIGDSEYYFPYSIIKPEIIEKYVYLEPQKEKEEKTNNEVLDEPYNIVTKDDDQLIVEDDYLYIHSEKLTYALNTDLNQIRKDLIDNIETNCQVSVDYSQLNTSSIGQYSVFYITNYEKIEIIIEIS